MLSVVIVSQLTEGPDPEFEFSESTLLRFLSFTGLPFSSAGPFGRQGSFAAIQFREVGRLISIAPPECHQAIRRPNVEAVFVDRWRGDDFHLEIRLVFDGKFIARFHHSDDTT